MSKDTSYVAQKMAEASYAFGSMLLHAGYSEVGDIERIIIRFKDLKTLYTVTRSIQQGMDSMYMRSTDDRPFDFKRDEGGLIYTDLVLAGMPYRFTTLERTTGYDIQPVIMSGNGWTSNGQPIDYGMAEERRRHP